MNENSWYPICETCGQPELQNTAHLHGVPLTLYDWIKAWEIVLRLNKTNG